MPDAEVGPDGRLIHARNVKGKPICGANTERGPCGSTSRMRNGRCNSHGGKATGRPITSGRIASGQHYPVMERLRSDCDRLARDEASLLNTLPVMTSDGRVTFCKVCMRRNARKVRDGKLEEARAIDRERAHTPQGRAAAIARMYEKRRRNPEQYQARLAVAQAIKHGSIVREPCEVCGATEKIHAHHDDYSKPLCVRWLCQKHHLEHHRNILRSKAESFSLAGRSGSLGASHPAAPPEDPRP